MQEELTHSKQHQTELKNLSDSRHNRITELESTVHALQRDLQTAQFREQGLYATIDELANSTSWRVTKPLRLASRLAKGDFRDAWRSIKRNVGVEVEQPRIESSKSLAVSSLPQPHQVEDGDIPESAWQGELVDIRSINPLHVESPGRIAIHAHVFYSDLVEEMAGHLAQIPWDFDLYVSAASREAAGICRKHFSNLSHLGKMLIKEVPNRGRDIAPMFTFFRDSLLEYDYVAHIHSKKSLYNQGATAGWREYLLNGLLGNTDHIRRVFRLLYSDQRIGLVYPQNYIRLPYMANTWLSNQGMGRDLCNRIGLDYFPTGYFSFPAGSMFWARVDALAPLFDLKLSLEDFPKEAGQTDGTLAHCLERMLGLSTQKTGFKSAILKDLDNLSWTPWRFEDYVISKREQFEDLILDLETRVVVFDIFDTLLLRPLLNPESIKNLVAKKIGGKEGELYLQLRGRAEMEARQQAGRDVGMEHIFSRFAELSGLPLARTESIRQQEESLELEAVSRRPELASLLEFAVAHGKRVVLASDMYLSRATIESMLNRHAISGWEELYLSSEIGVRKDSGALYEYLLRKENVLPRQILIIGDNEHSDLQIPWNLSVNCRHVLRPVELARSLPRLGSLIDKTLRAKDLNAELTLGLIVRDNFHPATYRDFDPGAFTRSSPWAIGYSILGPVVLSFIQWLIARAKADGVKRLYFLSREGQFLHAVFERYKKHIDGDIESRYLVVSRRCVTVAGIKSMEDIYSIARHRFFPGELSYFLKERFGLTLSERELHKLWPSKRQIDIEHGNISEIKSLLDALQDRIYRQAADERVGLLAYLSSMGLTEAVSSAVVDIGYSATIQNSLIPLVSRSIHGYYMATNTNAGTVANSHGVISQGCFTHLASSESTYCAIYEKSFYLEKLLSSNDPQIVRYHVAPDQSVNPEFLELSDAEQKAKLHRDMVQRGALAFVDEAISVRENLSEDLTVPTTLANEIYAGFIKAPSDREIDALQKLVLDDHYCGRGLVA